MQHVLIRFWYHVMYPKTELYPHLLARYLAIGFMENTSNGYKVSLIKQFVADHLRLALTVWEATLDGCLFVVLMASWFCCRSYVEEKRNPDPAASDPKQSTPAKPIKED